MYVQAIKISIAEELSICTYGHTLSYIFAYIYFIVVVWNAHARIDKSIAQAQIEEWSALTPQLSTSASDKTKIPTPTSAGPNSHSPDDLDTPDELGLRSLLLGISYRTTGDFTSSRAYLKDAYARQSAIRVSTWIPGVAMFEMAVLDLKVVEASERGVEKREKDGVDVDETGDKERADWERTGRWRGEWEKALTSASEKLDVALSLATSVVDLSSRLDSRVTMLKDEIGTKREMLGIL